MAVKKQDNKSKIIKIKMENVYKAFGDNHVLNGINLEIHQGESLVIIGGSGTGKSVLLKCILGLIIPDSGRILLDGEDITKIPIQQRGEIMQKFGMLFQGGALFDSLTVWENVAFSLIQNHHMPRKKAYEVAVEKLRSVGLGERVAKLFPAELSGGMQKRVSLARAVAGSPEIIFFDEPTTGLDPIMADVINDLIVKATKELGATGLTITHDMASARKVADDIAMIYEGKIIWRGVTKDIDNSGNEYVEQFIHGKAEGPIAIAV